MPDADNDLECDHLDECIDTGDILCQREIFFGDNDTLRTSYTKLERTIETI